MGTVSIYELVRQGYEYDCRKHDLAPDAEEFATARVNRMTMNELLYAISEAVEERLSNGSNS